MTHTNDGHVTYGAVHASGNRFEVRLVTDRVLSIVEYIDPDSGSPMIRDHTFVNCLITGPAVLVLAGEFTFVENELDTAMLWPIDDTSRRYIGGIGLEGVTFRRCRFENVGFAGPREVMDRFMQA